MRWLVLYFWVEDIRGAHQWLLAKGVTFVAAPHLIHPHPDGTEEWMAFFNDNEGRPLAVMAQVPALSTLAEIPAPSTPPEA